MTEQESPRARPQECFIHKLPFDITHDIFHLSNDNKSKKEMSIIISHVCRQWREYALNIPTMWNSLKFSRDGLKKGWAKQQVFLQRSKDATLDIEIQSVQGNNLLGISAVSRILRMLLPHIHRWRSLTICIHIKGMKVIGDRLRHASAPALEILSLNIWSDNTRPTKWRCRMFNGGPPNLRKWKTHLQLLPPPSAALEMDKLRELEVEGSPWYYLGLRTPTPPDVVRILSKCPNLENLFLKLDDYRTSSFDPAHLISDPITLPNLVSLRIGTSHGANASLYPVLHICCNICAPHVRTIVWPGIMSPFISATGPFIPFPGLQKLVFRGFSTPWPEATLDPPKLRAAFSNLQYLHDLTFYKQIMPKSLFEVLQRYLPHLLNLALDSCTFMMSNCVELVKARRASQSVASLQRLRIWKAPTEEHATWFRDNVPEFITKHQFEYYDHLKHRYTTSYP